MSELVPSVPPVSVVVSQARDAVESWVREFASLFATSPQTGKEKAMSSTYREGLGDGYYVTVQHCEKEGCDEYLGVNYPDEFCRSHVPARADEEPS